MNYYLPDSLWVFPTRESHRNVGDTLLRAGSRFWAWVIGLEGKAEYIAVESSLLSVNLDRIPCRCCMKQGTKIAKAVHKLHQETSTYH